MCFMDNDNGCKNMLFFFITQKGKNQKATIQQESRVILYYFDIKQSKIFSGEGLQDA